MLTLFQSIVYGIMQGVGEFLPISSTAHLALAPYVFGWQDPGLSFDVALHVGTLVAVVAYFWNDWIQLFRGGAQSLRAGLPTFYRDPLFFVIVATIPGGIFGYFFDSWAETVFRSPIIIACALIIAGFILYWFDTHASASKNRDAMTPKDAIIVGVSQAVAIIPGVSRSGATMAAGRALGYDRISATRFSFLLGTPIIAAAALLKLPQLFSAGFDSLYIVAIVTSAISGYLAISYMVTYIERHGFKPFFLYRLGLGVLVLLIVASRGF